MIFDFHSHTDVQDGQNSIEEMVIAAIEKGLSIYGSSEHAPRLPGLRYVDDPEGEVRGLARWSEYLITMDELKKKYDGQIELLKGCEVDWSGEENIEWVKNLIREGNFDYTIGSIHFLGEWGFDYIKDWRQGISNFESVEAIYHEYFLEYAEMVESGLFDIAGHLDLIKKFNDQYPLPKSLKILELAKPALDALKNSKMVLEISSAGLDKPCMEWYPSEDLLKETFRRGISITLSSDAHSTDRIADKFKEAKEFAKSVGYEEVVIFHQGGGRESVKI